VKKAQYPSRLPGIACPHCDSDAIARTSSQLDPLTRNIRLMCKNPDCAHIFVAQIAIYRTLRESLTPRADIARQLPLGQWVPQRRPANDDEPTPMNDDRLPAAVEGVPVPS